MDPKFTNISSEIIGIIAKLFGNKVQFSQELSER